MTGATAGQQVRFLQAGDRGLVVEFGMVVDERLNRLVAALDARLAASGIAGIVETVPTYRSLLVLYDPLVIRSRDLAARIAPLVPDEEETEGPRRRWSGPVAYGGDHGMDLEVVAQTHGLTTAEVIALHSWAEYRVYMIGFAPGFAYLGGLPPPLHTPRPP